VYVDLDLPYRNDKLNTVLLELKKSLIGDPFVLLRVAAISDSYASVTTVASRKREQGRNPTASRPQR